MHADVVIVGAGPAGIFTALKLLEDRPSTNIIMLEKGNPIERRHCPKDRTGVCVGCQPCNITTGFSGAGAFSDGKLSLSYEVGGDLPELIGAQKAQDTIDTVDKLYLAFGADTHVEGSGHNPQIRDIRRRAIQAGLKMVDCPSAIWAPKRPRSSTLPSRSTCAARASTCVFAPNAKIS